MSEVVKISGLSYSYTDGVHIHYGGMDFSVNAGQKVAILGPIGSGKSTLLQHILGLLQCTEGSIEVFGHDPVKESKQLRRRIGTLLQNVDQQIIAPTVWDDICFSPRNYGIDQEQTNERITHLMEKLDISHLKDKVPHYLSGGEKTKVGIAGALAHSPELLILDEPFEGLDPVCRNDLVTLLNDINKTEKTTIILSTHNINVVPRIADIVYIIAEGGNIIARGTPDEIFTQVEMLRSCHIEPPVLSALFYELRQKGIELDQSFSIKEAASIIAESKLK